MGRKPWPYVVVTTTPNGGAKKQTGYSIIEPALEQMIWLSMNEPLNETELVVRQGEGEMILRVV